MVCDAAASGACRPFVVRRGNRQRDTLFWLHLRCPCSAAAVSTTTTHPNASSPFAERSDTCRAAPVVYEAPWPETVLAVRERNARCPCCRIVAAVILQAKAGLTISQRCNVEVGSLSFGIKHLHRIQTKCRETDPADTAYRRCACMMFHWGTQHRAVSHLPDVPPACCEAPHHCLCLAIEVAERRSNRDSLRSKRDAAR